MNKLFLILLFAGIAKTQASSIHVYFGTTGKESQGIYRAKLNTENGKLSKAELAAEVGAPSFLALHPEKNNLYAIAQASGRPSVVAYEIQKNGELKLLNSVPTGDGTSAHLAVHPSGRFLLTAQYREGSVALFPIEADGKIGQRTQLISHTGGSKVFPKRQERPHPHYCGYSPDGRFALIADLGLDQIVIYRIDLEHRKIQPHGTIQALPGSGPRHMRFSIDGRWIYLLNELSLSVTTFSYEPTTATAQQITTTAALSPLLKKQEIRNTASEILVHPNGQFVYSANRGNDSVTVYRAHSETGELNAIEVEPIRGAWPRNINIDPMGSWLLAAGQHSNTVSVFKIDPVTGKLTFQPKQIISVPAPACILFHTRN